MFTGATVGPVDYSQFGGYLIAATTLGTVQHNHLPPVTATAQTSKQLAVATYNVENLAPGDPAAKYQRLAEGVVTNLAKPDVVAIEEVQDNTGATDDGTVAADQTLTKLTDAIVAAGGPRYHWREIDPVNDKDGGQPGGNIRVVFLFNPARVSFVDRGSSSVNRSTTGTAVVKSHGDPALTLSPGRIDPANPVWTASRKPLAGEFEFRGEQVFVIANHFNSKGGDQNADGRFQFPAQSSTVQRAGQAQVVHDFVEQILDVDRKADVVVLGDLNDYQFSPALAALRTGTADGSGPSILTDLIATLPKQPAVHLRVRRRLAGARPHPGDARPRRRAVPGGARQRRVPPTRSPTTTRRSCGSSRRALLGVELVARAVERDELVDPGDLSARRVLPGGQISPRTRSSRPSIARARMRHAIPLESRKPTFVRSMTNGPSVVRMASSSAADSSAAVASSSSPRTATPAASPRSSSSTSSPQPWRWSPPSSLTIGRGAGRNALTPRGRASRRRRPRRARIARAKRIGWMITPPAMAMMSRTIPRMSHNMELLLRSMWAAKVEPRRPPRPSRGSGADVSAPTCPAMGRTRPWGATSSAWSTPIRTSRSCSMPTSSSAPAATRSPACSSSRRASGTSTSRARPTSTTAAS